MLSLLLLLLLGSLRGSSSFADHKEQASESDRAPALRDANGDIESADLRDRCRSRGAGVFAGVGSVGRSPLAVDIGNAARSEGGWGRIRRCHVGTGGTDMLGGDRYDDGPVGFSHQARCARVEGSITALTARSGVAV